MSFCYCCHKEAQWRVMEDQRPVCDYHRDEAIEEEGPILVSKIDYWEERINERQSKASA